MTILMKIVKTILVAMGIIILLIVLLFAVVKWDSDYNNNKWFRYELPDENKSKYVKGEDKIISSIGDEFIVEYETGWKSGYPEYETWITIWSKPKGNNALGGYRIEKGYVKPELEIKHKSEKLLVYELKTGRGTDKFFKFNGKRFESRTNSRLIIEELPLIDGLYVQGYVGKDYSSTDPSAVLKAFKLEDKAGLQKLERYAKGDFTSDERKAYSNDVIETITSSASSILRYYNEHTKK